MKNNNRYPDFLVVGAGRSGTTSLHVLLSEHPEIVLPKEIKETLFWHIISNPNKSQTKHLKRYIGNIDDYLELFSGTKDNQICGEVTPSYLYYHDFVISNLKKIHPNWKNLKIVIILREPVSKVISHFHFVTNHLKIKDKSLKQALQLENKRLKENKCLPDLYYLDNTMYYKQVKAFQENFKNLKILFFEDLKNDPSLVMRELCSFLEVDSTFNFSNLEKKHNASIKKMIPKNKISEITQNTYRWFPFKTLIKHLIPTRKIYNKLNKKESIDEKTKIKLKELFREDVLSLQKLIGIDLKSKWNY
ncbi:MAG: sulfotransferase [Candidatus Omnitrophota bacterium]